MSIAAMLTAALIAAPALAGDTPSAAAPPLVIGVVVAKVVPPDAVRIALSEVDAIYRSTGVRFMWRDEHAPVRLRVRFGDYTGPSRGTDIPLGWLTFEHGVPAEDIFISHVNTVQYMESATEVIPRRAGMTLAERNLMLGRAMGRALAHELAHYLLLTPQHHSKGLLRATHSFDEFFGPNRVSFAIDLSERRQMAVRMQQFTPAM